MELTRFLPIARDWQLDHQRPTETIHTTVRAHGCENVTNIETKAGYINQQLAQIVEMITEAQPLGATHLYWWQ